MGGVRTLWHRYRREKAHARAPTCACGTRALRRRPAPLSLPPRLAPSDRDPRASWAAAQDEHHHSQRASKGREVVEGVEEEVRGTTVGSIHRAATVTAKNGRFEAELSRRWRRELLGICLTIRLVESYSMSVSFELAFLNAVRVISPKHSLSLCWFRACPLQVLQVRNRQD